MAPTSRNRAGSSDAHGARATRTTPSSSGWRSASSTDGGNSPSSSRNSTPPWARLISPGRSARGAAADERRRADAPWCGARNGGRRDQPVGRQRRPAAECTRVASSAAVVVEGGQQAGQAPGEHRLAGAGRPDEQQVVAAGRGDLEREPGDGLAAHVGQVGRGPGTGAGGATAAARATAASPLSAATSSASVADGRMTVPLDEPWPRGRRCGTTTTARLDARRPAAPRRAPTAPSRRARARRGTPDRPRASPGKTVVGHQHADGDGEVEPRAGLAHARRREVDRDPLVAATRGRDVVIAARTRSRASRHAASGRPTMVKPGQARRRRGPRR